MMVATFPAGPSATAQHREMKKTSSLSNISLGIV